MWGSNHHCKIRGLSGANWQQIWSQTCLVCWSRVPPLKDMFGMSSSDHSQTVSECQTQKLQVHARRRIWFC